MATIRKADNLFAGTRTPADAARARERWAQSLPGDVLAALFADAQRRLDILYKHAAHDADARRRIPAVIETDRALRHEITQRGPR